MPNMSPVSSTFQPFAPPQLDDPYPFFAEARREQPVFFSELLRCWVVTRYEDIYAIIQDPLRFSSAGNIAIPRQGLSGQAQAVLDEGSYRDAPLVNDDPPVHTRWRKVFNQLFARDAIAALKPMIRATAEEMVAGFIQDGQAEMVSRFAYPLPMRVILTWLGVPLDMMDTIKRWCDDWVLLLFASAPPEQHEPLAHSAVALQRYLAGLISERLEHPREDAMSILATRLIEGVQPSPQDLAGMVAGTLAAGNETTTSMLGHALRLLLVQPERWQLLREQPALIPQAVEEVLRLEPPLMAMSRVTTEPVEVGGVAMPAGTRLLLAFASGNRDEARFERAAEFELGRGNVAQHMAFGKGVHVCVGAGLARLEGRVALEVLTEKLPNARLVPGEPFVYVPGLLRQHARLPVAWD